MKRTILLLTAICCFLSCSEKETNLILTGKVKGLKKGTLFLQKIEDTSLINIDSILVNGDPAFSFKTYIENPQVLFLYLKKVDNSQYDDRLSFFAEPGKMTIHTNLKNFRADAVTKGSKNQEKLEDYEKMVQQFNNKRLELIKADLLAQKQESQKKIDSLTKKFENLIKRKYLFTVNFAINNKEFEVAPYLAVSQIYDANIKYLDTIYNSLPAKVQQSKYGKDLEVLIKERREMEKTSAK